MKHRYRFLVGKEPLTRQFSFIVRFRGFPDAMENHDSRCPCCSPPTTHTAKKTSQVLLLLVLVVGNGLINYYSYSFMGNFYFYCYSKLF